MDFRIEQKPSIQMMGIFVRTSNAENEKRGDIIHLWQRFYQDGILYKIPNRASEEIFALYTDYSGDYTQPYTLVIGAPVSNVENIPEGMTVKTIPASTYAVFTAKGEFPQSLIETWGTIWKSKLSRSYTGDFELYRPEFQNKKSDEVDVYIALKGGKLS